MVAGFSVDATEVSNGQYEAFLAVEFEQEFFDALPAGCEFKTDFTPEDFPNNPNPDLPVVNVDWCDAYAYCEWAGQELCGAIGGGPNDYSDWIDWNTSQWYRACTTAGVFEYPYGVLYEPTNCNTEDAQFGGVTEVGAFNSCEGGFPGLFDMSGNVWEWENSCNDMGECRRRGGSYFSDASNSRCGVGSSREREFRNGNVGFRCCETL